MGRIKQTEKTTGIRWKMKSDRIEEVEIDAIVLGSNLKIISSFDS